MRAAEARRVDESTFPIASLEQLRIENTSHDDQQESTCTKDKARVVLLLPSGPRRSFHLEVLKSDVLRRWSRAQLEHIARFCKTLLFTNLSQMINVLLNMLG